MVNQIVEFFIDCFHIHFPFFFHFCFSSAPQQYSSCQKALCDLMTYSQAWYAPAPPARSSQYFAAWYLFCVGFNFQDAFAFHTVADEISCFGNFRKKFVSLHTKKIVSINRCMHFHNNSCLFSFHLVADEKADFMR